MKITHIINSAQVKYFLFFFFFLSRYLQITMIIPSFILFAASFAVAKASSIFPGGNELVARKSDIKYNGSPGAVCYADAYNNLGNNWNHTYTDFEPQQIHLSLTDDAKYARVQFATLGEIKHSVLQYWPKTHNHKHKKSITTIKGEVIIHIIIAIPLYIHTQALNFIIFTDI